MEYCSSTCTNTNNFFSRVIVSVYFSERKRKYFNTKFYYIGLKYNSKERLTVDKEVAVNEKKYINLCKIVENSIILLRNEYANL